MRVQKRADRQQGDQRQRPIKAHRFNRGVLLRHTLDLKPAALRVVDPCTCHLKRERGLTKVISTAFELRQGRLVVFAAGGKLGQINHHSRLLGD